MDKYKVKVNPRAIHELDHIYEYIAKEKSAPENAKGQVDRIKKSILSLDTFPQSHQERNEGRYARLILMRAWQCQLRNPKSVFASA